MPSFSPTSGSVVVGIAAGPTGWSQGAGYTSFGTSSWSSGGEYAVNWAGQTNVPWTNAGTFGEVAVSFAPLSGAVSSTTMDIHFTPNCLSVSSTALPSSSDEDNIRNASLANAQYIRFDIWWNSTEPHSNMNAPSSCAIGYYTQLLSDMKSQGLKAVAIVGTMAPGWVQNSCFFSTDEPAWAETYASWVAQDLGSLVTYYQLGNELNWYPDLFCSTSATQLIQGLAQGIQQGQPSGSPYSTIVNIFADKVCFPQGLGYSWTSDMQNWLNVVGTYINVIAIDHYPGYYCGGYWATDGFLSGLASLAASNPGKSYAITETGWSTFSSSADAQDAFAKQALGAIYSFAKSQLGSNPLLFVGWLRLTDNGEPGPYFTWTPQECCFGLQTAQTANRPAYFAISSYFAQFLGKQFVTVGYPFNFAESGFDLNTNWCVTFNNQYQCSRGASMSFNAMPASFAYTITNPGCGSGCRYIISSAPPSPVGTTTTYSAVTVSVTATKQYQATMAVSPAGSGSTSPSGTSYYNAGSLSISASSGSSYHFSNWSTNNPSITLTCSTCASTTATLNGAGTITANFAINVYSVTFRVSPSGSGSTSPSGTVNYNAGSTPTITATAGSGYAFSSWSVTSGLTVTCSTCAQTTLTVAATGTVTANFITATQYYLTMQVSGTGTVTPSSGYHNAGSQVTITGYPSGIGTRFCYWLGSGTGSYSGSSNPATVTMNSAVTETAVMKSLCPQNPVLTPSSPLGLWFLLPALAASAIGLQWKRNELGATSNDSTK